MVLEAELEPLLILAIALALGFLIGIEREWARKGVGVRTFPLIAMSTALAGYVSQLAGLIALAAVGVLVAAISSRSRRNGLAFGTTTNMAMVFTAVLGFLVGLGYFLLAVAAGVLAAWSLAWKEELRGFATGLSRVELRSGLQLALLAFVVFPFLPDQTMDPWGLINPHTVWWVVIIMGLLASANYLLLKMIGGRSLLYSAFLGALVNSLASVTAVIDRVRDDAELRRYGAACVLLGVMGMMVKNLILFWLLYPAGGPVLTTALGVMLLVAALAAAFELNRLKQFGEGPEARVDMPSPFSLQLALGFGLFFLVFVTAGGMSYTELGSAAFYLAITVGSLVSSGTATAAAAVLAAQEILTLNEGVVAVVLASTVSLTSKVVTTQLVGRDGGQTRRVALLLLLPAAAGVAAIMYLPG